MQSKEPPGTQAEFEDRFCYYLRMIESSRYEYRIVPAADPEAFKKINIIGKGSDLEFALERFDPDHPEYPHIRINHITVKEAEIIETLKAQAAKLEGLDNE